MKLAIIPAIAALCLVASHALAQEPMTEAETTMQVGIGPMVGSPAPSLESAVAVPPASGQVASGEQGRVLVFVRSADWCPFCKTQLVDLNDITGDLAEAGWALEAISYDSPETLAAFSQEKGLNYTLLSDEGSAIIDAFGLRNMEVRSGSRTDGIPHPAIVFISADGAVKAVLREEGYRDRPSEELIMETADLLSQVEMTEAE